MGKDGKTMVREEEGRGMILLMSTVGAVILLAAIAIVVGAIIKLEGVEDNGMGML